MDCSLPGSFVHGVLQAEIVEWVAVSSSRGSSRPRDQTHISYIPCIGRQVLYHWCHLGTSIFRVEARYATQCHRAEQWATQSPQPTVLRWGDSVLKQGIKTRWVIWVMHICAEPLSFCAVSHEAPYLILSSQWPGRWAVNPHFTLKKEKVTFGNNFRRKSSWIIFILFYLVEELQRVSFLEKIHLPSSTTIHPPPP